MQLLTALFLITLPFHQTYSDELIFSTNLEAVLNGYQLSEIPKANPKTYRLPIQRNQVSWPFESVYQKSIMGNNFTQFQPYSIPAYHGGCDMILNKGAWIIAPIDGVLSAGHYSYKNNPNGSKQKFIKPWPETGSRHYFELAIKTDDGMFIEIHHVDRNTLPQNIINGLDSGNFRVTKGMKLGKVINWPTNFHYHHVHINVFDPSGKPINPEFYFKPVKDTTKPIIKVVAEFDNGDTSWVVDNSNLNDVPEKFYIISKDLKDGQSYYQAPLYFKLIIKELKLQKVLDFRRSYYLKDKIIDFRMVYPRSLVLPNGQSLSQMNSYYPVTKNTYFITQLSGMAQLPIRNDMTFEIQVADFMGNTTSIKGKF